MARDLQGEHLAVVQLLEVLALTATHKRAEVGLGQRSPEQQVDLHTFIISLLPPAAVAALGQAAPAVPPFRRQTGDRRRLMM
jgi:hypothetical protein